MNYRLDICPRDSAGGPSEMWDEFGTYPDRARAEIMRATYCRTMSRDNRYSAEQVARIVRVNADGSSEPVGGDWYF
jgi:hypothetical protein